MTFFEYLRKEEPQGRVLILRHDVDASVELLQRMTEVEERLQMRSTIFVRTKAAGYSLSEPKNATIIQSLQAASFELGLHYEFSESEDNVFETLRQDKLFLENTINSPIVGASAHRPTVRGFFLTPELRRGLGLQYEAYEERFTRQMKYLSDSRRCWREGCFCGWIGRAARLQVLVHPVWWSKGSKGRMPEILRLV